jgi:UDPglucose 6-dehydrogenase
MKVSMVGMGYVGLVSGVCLAEAGHEVTCVDLDAKKVAQVNQGRPPIFEEGLEELLKKHLGRRFAASVDLEAAVLDSELTMIAVGTPFDGEQIDLSFVRESARQIGAALEEKKGFHVVVVKSTVVPGTTDTLVRAVLEEASGKKAGVDFGLAMNPEFLTEGTAVNDFLRPDRIVLGALDGRSLEALLALYAPFPGVPIIRTNPRTAELIKYASNALLATAISFSNELANLCSALGGVDVVEVMEGVHASAYLNVDAGQGRRVKAPITAFLQAGCGFGGSCLPKDVKALVAHASRVGVRMPVLQAVLDVNAGRTDELLRLLERTDPALKGLSVGVLGLSFKPDTDDIRESPSLKVIRALLDRGVSVRVYDPVAMPAARKALGDAVEYAPSLDACLTGVQAALLLTRWGEFEALPQKLAAMPHPPLLIDGRRQLGKTAVRRYAGIGL